MLDLIKRALLEKVEISFGEIYLLLMPAFTLKISVIYNSGVNPSINNYMFFKGLSIIFSFIAVYIVIKKIFEHFFKF